MMDKTHKLPLRGQARLLDVSRSSVYYQPKAVSDEDLAMMWRMDELHLLYPFFGARRLAAMLRRDGHTIGRKHVSTLMKLMGMSAIYRKPRTTERNPGHKVYPYLLRDLVIDKPNQVWAMDITYIPMAHGFVYLAAVLDWHTRKVLTWKLSISLEADFCVEALEEALSLYGKPEIFNTDQGSQFTGHTFIKVLQSHDIQISMDGKGAWRDNIFVERFWWSIKYEEVYLKAYESVPQARQHLSQYINFYNTIRPHQNLNDKTPDEVYFSPLPALLAA